MRAIGLRYIGAVVALAICSACSGAGAGSAVAPSAATPALEYKSGMAFINGRPVTAARPNPNAHDDPVSLASGGFAKKSKYFDYIIDVYGSYATIFNYPTSDKQIGTLKNVGGQGCTNVLYGYGKKIVWIVAAYNQISEFNVPTKLVKSLSVPSTDFPSSCAMDTQGDLAVGIVLGDDAGDVVIFKNASGKGTFVKTLLAREFFDGYDSKGNLFFDGFTSTSAFQIDEIPKGSKKVVAITPSDTIGFPGSVQWDGKYVTVLDQDTGTIHRYTVSGTKATLKDTIVLTGTSDCAQTWIATGVVYCGDAGNNNGSVFGYPSGKPLAVFSGTFDEPLGTTAAMK